MSLAVYFHPENMSAKQYDEIIKKLEAAGHGSPKGRSHHSAFGPADRLMVYDVWDSQADFDAFGAALMPVLAEAGVDPGQPEVMPVHNLIQ
jgi:hypothetical protein